MKNFFKWLWALVIKIFVFIKTRLEVNDYYLVLNGNSKNILKRLSKGTAADFSDKAQLALLKRGVHEEIMALLCYKTTCEKADKLIVARQEPSELLVFCKKNRVIAEDLLWRIIRTGFEKPVLAIIENQQSLTPEEQSDIVGLGNQKLTRALVDKGKLANSEIVKLIRKGYSNISALLPRFYDYSPEVFMSVLEYSHINDVEYVVENFDLPENCVMFLLEHFADDVDIMDALLEKDYLSDKVQLEIINRLSHDCVMTLLDKQLAEKTCLAVVQKGDMAEIAKLIATQDNLPQEVIDALLVRNVHSELQSLAKNQPLDNSVLMTWIQHCRFDYVKLYLSHHKASTALIQLFLLELLERTVK